MKIAGDVDENANLSEEDEKSLRREIARHCRHRVTIEIKRYQKPRSNQQNKAVMGFWMSIIMEETGHHPHEYDSVYYGIKAKCWYIEEVSKITGEVIPLPKETKGLDTIEYSKFMESFRAYVLDFFGIHLPDPIRTMAMI